MNEIEDVACEHFRKCKVHIWQNINILNIFQNSNSANKNRGVCLQNCQSVSNIAANFLDIGSKVTAITKEIKHPDMSKFP